MVNFIIFLCVFIIIVETVSICKSHLVNVQQEKRSFQQEQQELSELQDKIYKSQKEINELSSQKAQLLQDITKEKENNEQLYEKEKNKIAEQIEAYKDNLSYASEQYADYLERDYDRVEEEYNTKVQILERQKQEKKDVIQQYEDKIEDLKNTLSAGARAQLREREKEEQLNFYKLSVSDTDLEDILKLNNLKLSLHQPVILSKLIWTTYFQKQTTELCNRVLGTKTVCGIYKITNIQTQQCYIGQSVSVSDRLKQHIKCGLGIEASTTNKLYSAMNAQGVWNFTFELMEECPKEQLNEKEAFWIDLYGAADFGYNTTRGNR